MGKEYGVVDLTMLGPGFVYGRVLDDDGSGR
jgi:hypothetical protein